MRLYRARCSQRPGVGRPSGGIILEAAGREIVRNAEVRYLISARCGRGWGTGNIAIRLGTSRNRAARLIERIEAEGVVSQANHIGEPEVFAAERVTPKGDRIVPKPAIARRGRRLPGSNNAAFPWPHYVHNRRDLRSRNRQESFMAGPASF